MRQRLDHVDGLRGIAAMLVVIGHWAEKIAQQPVPAALSDGLRAVFLEYFSTGRAGVVAFFCISGFVIPFSFKGDRPLAGFVVSRIFRLYPAYWLAIVLFLAIVPATLPDRWNLLVNLSMLTRFAGQPYILPIAWTLTIELLFYLICFAAHGVRLLHSPRFNFAMMLFFCAAALGMAAYRWQHPQSGMPAGLQTFLAAMHFGTLVRLWVLEGKPQAATLGRLALAILVVAVTAANVMGYYHTVARGAEDDIGWVAINTGYLAGLFLFLTCIRWHLFRDRASVFLGTISYALYLLHPVGLAMAMSLWPRFAQWPVAVVVLTPAYVAGSLLLSTLVFRMVERPAIRAGRGLIARMPPARSADPAIQPSPVTDGNRS